ncbi:MAG TPA: hypothetical protein VGK53_05675 [Propionicimonas sp.]
MRDNTPWAAQIRASFTDPAVQDAVDDFLAQTVQPHVTKLEQQTADLKDAQELYNDLQNDPGATYVALTQQLFGEDAANKVVATLQAEESADTPGEEPPAKSSALDPEDAEFLQRARERERQEQYDKAINDFKADNRDDLVPKYFHPFVAGANGDLEQAYAAYKEWLGGAKKEVFGIEDTLDPNEVPDLPPPATVGKGEANAVTTPPTVPNYRSIGDAIDDVWSDFQAGPPPTVGSV